MRKLLIVTLVVVAACGGGGSDSPSTTAATGTTAATDYVLIRITALEFPAETVIPAGKSVASQSQMLVLH